MTVSSVYGSYSNTGTTETANKSSGFASLGQEDFFRLMTTQMQMQDPFNPVDNTEMLAQMAQFSQLAGVSEMGDTLKTIADKLDALLAQQEAAAPPTGTAPPTETPPPASTQS